MKLIYKLFSFALLSGAAVTTYLLIPSAPIEVIESGPEPLPEIKKSSVSWKKSFMDQGYVPVSMTDAFEDFPNLLETFTKAKNIEEDQARAELRKLCNSLNEKDTLSDNEKIDAKRWCVNPRKVRDILKDRGRKYVYTVENDIETWNSQKTKELARKYMENQLANLKMETSWNNSSPLTLTEKDFEGDLEIFKGACTYALDAKSFEDNLEQKIERAEKWCTES